MARPITALNQCLLNEKKEEEEEKEKKRQRRMMLLCHKSYAIPLYSKIARSLRYQVSPKLKVIKKLKVSIRCLEPHV